MLPKYKDNEYKFRVIGLPYPFAAYGVVLCYLRENAKSAKKSFLSDFPRGIAIEIRNTTINPIKDENEYII